MREVDIQKQLLDWLKLKGFMVWRNNTGAGQMASGRFVRFGQKGSADILGVVGPRHSPEGYELGGLFLAVEVKRPGEKPTQEQESWLEAIRRQGGIAVVADSIEALEQALRQEGVRV